MPPVDADGQRGIVPADARVKAVAEPELAGRPNALVGYPILLRDLLRSLTDEQMTRLRRKIERDPRFPRYLQTIRGTGYALKVD